MSSRAQRGSPFFVLEISCHPSLLDLVQGRLFLTESSGNSVDDAGPNAIVTAYFDSAEARERAAAMLADLDVRLRRIEQPAVDWLEQYQQSLRPLFIGPSFVIAPEASLIRVGARRHTGGDRRHRLVIPQEQAFGTGSHESTALCVELLEPLDLRGARALDVGSGSGILALAMLRLGARKVVAFDIDLDAFRPLRDNRRRNGIAAEQMPLFIGTIDALRGGRFDAVTANILPEVIAPLLPALTPRLAGTLITSGILASQRDPFVTSCQRAGLRLESEAIKGEWWAGSFRL